MCVKWISWRTRILGIFADFSLFFAIFLDAFSVRLTQLHLLQAMKSMSGLGMDTEVMDGGGGGCANPTSSSDKSSISSGAGAEDSFLDAIDQELSQIEKTPEPSASEILLPPVSPSQEVVEGILKGLVSAAVDISDRNATFDEALEKLQDISQHNRRLFEEEHGERAIFDVPARSSNIVC